MRVTPLLKIVPNKYTEQRSQRLVKERKEEWKIVVVFSRRVFQKTKRRTTPVLSLSSSHCSYCQKLSACEGL